jgi:NAD(P) transhydrogenase subunit alpha
VIWNVTPALHTPLMSVTNAISGIIVVGGMLQVSGGLHNPASLLGAAAILLAAINVVGGFLVTQRMLRMFRR